MCVFGNGTGELLLCAVPIGGDLGEKVLPDVLGRL